MASRSPSRGRYRSRSRSQTPQSQGSRSPSRRHRRYDSRSPTRSPTPPPRRNGRDSRSWSRNRGRDSRDRSASPAIKSTKIVVERLSKNMTEQHLYEIFGQFGPITDLDLPINRTFGTNRGTAYILFDHLSDAEAAIAHMHEAQVDGATINVSIVLPRKKLSPAPPTARRGANIDPRVPFTSQRGGGPSGGAGGGGFNGGGGRRPPSPSSRYGPRSDVYRPGSRSPSRSSLGAPPSRGGGNRHRSRSAGSYTSRSPSRSRSRSRSPAQRRRRGNSRGGDHGSRRRSRSRSYDGYNDRDRSRSPARGGRGHR